MIPYQPEPFTDFSIEKNRQAFEEALGKVKQRLGKEYAIEINGEAISTTNTIHSINPSDVNEVIGTIYQADEAIAEKAIQAAAETFKTWKRVSPEARARVLFKSAAILRRKKHEFSAWLVLEAGKSWSEADGDTAEAIDFMEFYAREMLRLSERQPLTRIPGEDNNLTYIPLGVGIVIPPWNFPLAIMAGMYKNLASKTSTYAL